MFDYESSTPPPRRVTKKYETLSGLVTTDPVRTDTSGGYQLLKFSMRIGEKFLPCVRFGKTTDADLWAISRNQGVVSGAKITVKGSKTSGGDFAVVEWYTTALVPKKDRNVELYASHGGEANYRKFRSEQDAYQQSRGFVWTWNPDSKSSSYQRLEWTVRYRGRYWMAMDFCLEVLGGAYVSAELKKLHLKPSELMASAYARELYASFLRGLTGLARQQSKVSVAPRQVTLPAIAQPKPTLEEFLY